MVRIGFRVERALSAPLFVSIIRSAITKNGNTVQTQTLRDLDHLRQFLSGPGPMAIFDTPWVPVYFTVIFLFHTWLGILAVIGALVLLTLSLVNELASRKPLALASSHSTRGYTIAEAGRRNAEVLCAMAMVDDFRNRWSKARHTSLSHQASASDVAGTLTTTSKIIRLFLQSLMLALGAYLAILEEITPGVMIAASIILSRALAPIEQSIGQWRGFIGARQGTRRIAGLLANAPATDDKMILPEPRGVLSVNKMDATAPGVNKATVKSLDFALAPGDALGVIGPSASGKSTLARAIVGVWPVVRGDVRLDNAALDQWEPNQLGRRIGYLPQDVELFDGTVEENIARFQPEHDSADVVQAARKAGVHDLILHLPDGYGTRIGEGGAVLSAGQRQRVALARALYGNPVLIVLDEPNSNLDAEGEAALSQAILTLREEEKTVVVMAHRPSVIAAVNKLLFLREGQQIAFGPKEEVLEKHVAGAQLSGKADNVRKMPEFAKSG